MLLSLCNEYERVDSDFTDTDQEVHCLQTAIKKSFELFQAMEMHAKNAARQPSRGSNLVRSFAAEDRHVQQVIKLGRYWNSCPFLVKAARQYPDLFSHTRLEYIKPYQSKPSRISMAIVRDSRKTSVECHVHAEIQLITFYHLSQDQVGRVPRWIGVSKNACFLCDLFVQIHGQFSVSKTHGQLYDQWTVPDLADFTAAQRNDYRRIIRAMNRACLGRLKAIAAVLKNKRRHSAYPNTSKRDLLEHKSVSSIVTSLASISEANVGVDQHPNDVSRQGSTQTIPLRIAVAPARDNPIDEGATAMSRPQLSTQSLQENYSSPSSHHPSMHPLETSVSHLTSENDSQEELSMVQSSPESSIDVASSPIERKITSDTPLTMLAPDVRLFFEIGNPRTGNIRVSIPSGKSIALDTVIDVNTMAPGEIVKLYQDDASETLQFDIHGISEQAIRIGLKWVRD